MKIWTCMKVLKMSDKINCYILGKEHTWGGPKTFTRNFRTFLDKNLIRLHWRKLLGVGKSDFFIIINGNSQLVKQLFIYLFHANKLTMRVGAYVDASQYRHGSYSGKIKGMLRRLVMYINFFLCDKFIFQSKFSYSKHNTDPFIRKILRNKSYVVIHNPIRTLEIISNNTVDETYLLCVEGSAGTPEHEVILSNFARYMKIKVVGNYTGRNIANIQILGKLKHEEVLRQLERNPLGFLCLEQQANCPNAVIEALAHGLPVLGSDNGALMELCSDAGILWPGQAPSPDWCSKNIDYLKYNRAALAESAIEQANKFDGNKVFTEYLNFIQMKFYQEFNHFTLALTASSCLRVISFGYC